ncbi:unnamed protein product [Linum trigynum]|uniref:CCHC-type domain-containing protein n=1 Tax=Linum trigynum TaxID=586398 RepID=A0AAV2ERC0_9ROSI
MKEDESVNDYFGRVMVVSNSMRNNGENMSDVKIVEKILRTLTERFNYVVCSIEESKDIDTLTVDALQSSLLVHEQRLSRRRREEDQALKIAFDDGNRRAQGHGSCLGRGRHHDRSWNRKTIECFICHKVGHFRYECLEQNQQAHYANGYAGGQADMKENVLLMAEIDLEEEEIHVLPKRDEQLHVGFEDLFGV